MEELYESEVMWSQSDYQNQAASSRRFVSPKRHHNGSSSLTSAGVNIPVARRAHSTEHQESDERELVPPHVMVSTRNSSLGKVAYSVCSGQGRTLKGRDLRHVRDSVMRMTGFLES